LQKKKINKEKIRKKNSSQEFLKKKLTLITSKGEPNSNALVDGDPEPPLAGRHLLGGQICRYFLHLHQLPVLLMKFEFGGGGSRL
jgi:hypothetical protein